MLQGLYPDSESKMNLQMLWKFIVQPSMSDRKSKSKSKGQAGTEPQPLGSLGGERRATAGQSVQEDFENTRSRLQKIVEDADHIFILHPKFHCELNGRAEKERTEGIPGGGAIDGCAPARMEEQWL